MKGEVGREDTVRKVAASRDETSGEAARAREKERKREEEEKIGG